MSTSRELNRPEAGRVFAGVCAGLAHYFGLNVLLVRLLFVAFIFAEGFGLFLYLILWILVPTSKRSAPKKKKESKGSIFLIVVLLLSTLWLLTILFPIEVFDWNIVWSLILLLIGFWIFMHNKG